MPEVSATQAVAGAVQPVQYDYVVQARPVLRLNDSNCASQAPEQAQPEETPLLDAPAQPVGAFVEGGYGRYLVMQLITVDLAPVALERASDCTSKQAELAGALPGMQQGAARMQKSCFEG